MGAIKVSSVILSPYAKNKLLVTFSENADLTTATVPGNYTFTPALTVQWAAFFSGLTQLHLHFGTDLAVDGSTHACWYFDEASGNILDSGVNAYTLTPTLTTVIEDGGYKRDRFFGGGANEGARSAVTDTPRAVVLGEWTLDAYVRWNSAQGDSVGTIFQYGGDVTSELQAENLLARVTVTKTTGILVIMHENGAGVDASWTTTYALVSGVHTLLTIRKRALAGYYVYDLFVNGLLHSSSPSLTNADGATGTNNRIYVGNDRVGTVGRFYGEIDTLRLSSVARTDDEIWAYAKALAEPIPRNVYQLQVDNVKDSATGTPITGSNRFNYVSTALAEDLQNLLIGSDFGLASNQSRAFSGELTNYATAGAPVPSPTPPVISNFSPNLGQPVTYNTVLGFDVTDATGLAHVMIVADFPRLRLQEVIHDGTSFGPLYQSNLNTRQAITDGYRYRVLREGGWPMSPTIRTYAVDVEGTVD